MCVSNICTHPPTHTQACTYIHLAIYPMFILCRSMYEYKEHENGIHANKNKFIYFASICVFVHACACSQYAIKNTNMYVCMYMHCMRTKLSGTLRFDPTQILCNFRFVQPRTYPEFGPSDSDSTKLGFDSFQKLRL